MRPPVVRAPRPHPARLLWMGATLSLLLVLLLVACGGPGGSHLPEVEVTPARGPVGGGVSVKLSGGGLTFPDGADAGRWIVLVCGAPLQGLKAAGGSLTGVTGAGGELGVGDVIVFTPDNQTVVLEDAFECHEASPSVEEFGVADARPAGNPTRFEWRVVGVDGEALGCTLDPDDGSEPYEIADCLATTSQEHTYQAGGSVTARLTVTGSDGQASRELTFVVGQVPPVANPDEVTVGVAELPLRIAAADLLANDEGEGLSVDFIAGNPYFDWDAAAGILTYDPGARFERLANGESDADWFAYTLTDAHGAMAAARVTLNIIGADRVLRVSIDGGEPEELLAGNTLPLSASVDRIGDVDQVVLWSSSDSRVATVDEASGEVTGRATGSVTVTATSRLDRRVSGSVTLRVTRGLELTIDMARAHTDFFELPLYGSGTVTIDWGDGTVETLTDPNGPTHNYGKKVYTIRVMGALSGNPRFGKGTSMAHENEAFTSVDYWGELGLTSLSGAFNASWNLVSVPPYIPAGVTDVSYMFMDATVSQPYESILSQWDTSNVVDMRGMFSYATSFDGAISGWNTSSVTHMDGMFDRASSFRQDLSGWCVENIASEPPGFSAATHDWSHEFHPRWGEACGL